MRKKDFIYLDYQEDEKYIGQIRNTDIIGPVYFEVNICGDYYKCYLHRKNIDDWYLKIDGDEELIDLAHPTDTYWNARQILDYIGDSGTSCAISGALCEIYLKLKDILE